MDIGNNQARLACSCAVHKLKFIKFNIHLRKPCL